MGATNPCAAVQKAEGEQHKWGKAATRLLLAVVCTLLSRGRRTDSPATSPEGVFFGNTCAAFMASYLKKQF